MLSILGIVIMVWGRYLMVGYLRVSRVSIIGIVIMVLG